MTLPLRGGPDNQAPGYQIAGAQVDPGLASEFVSLGLSRLDSLGRPFLFDDFSGGLAEVITTTAAGGTVQAYGLLGYAAPQCALLNSNGGVGGSATITKAVTNPPSNRLGIEIAIYPTLAGTPTDILTIELKNGALNLDGQLVWNGFSSLAWVYKNSGGTFTNLGSTIHGQEWTRVKMVVDFLGGTYLSFIIPSSDPSKQRILNTSALFAPGAGVPSLSMSINTFNNGANHSPYGIGYMLVTVDEP